MTKLKNNYNYKINYCYHNKFIYKEKKKKVDLYLQQFSNSIS